MNKLLELIKEKQVFIKYVFVAGSSFFIDLLLFNIFSNVFKNIWLDTSILISTILARIISSFYNYVLNRNAVFAKKDGKMMDKHTISKYYVLVLVQMLVSAGTVTSLFNLTHINETLIKIPVDIIIFIVNYIVQKQHIFR